MGTGAFPEKISRGVGLNTHSYLAPKLKEE